MLRRLVPVVAMCSLVVPGPAMAWEAPAGSPPGWQAYWVRSVEPLEIFVDAFGDNSFGQAPAGLFFRVDAPEQNARLWVYDPLVNTWAWVPSIATERVLEPSTDLVEASVQALDPRDYLYQQAPDVAPMLDCIIAGESGWDPAQQNARSRAAGLAQFLPTTWAATPQGQEGLSPFEPLANIDAAIWLARTRGWNQWAVYLAGHCH